MIEEILKEIASVEEEAEKRRKDAYLQGKAIVLEAEARAEKMKSDIVDKCKKEMKQSLAKAEEKALKRRSEILADGENKASQLIAEKAKDVDEMSDKILEIFVEKYK